MVNVNRLKAQMALKGYSQRTLVDAMVARGCKITVNTFTNKMRGRSKFDCEDADTICEILEVEAPEERANIFLA